MPLVFLGKSCHHHQAHDDSPPILPEHSPKQAQKEMPGVPGLGSALPQEAYTKFTCNFKMPQKGQTSALFLGLAHCSKIISFNSI